MFSDITIDSFSVVINIGVVMDFNLDKNNNKIGKVNFQLSDGAKLSQMKDPESISLFNKIDKNNDHICSQDEIDAYLDGIKSNEEQHSRVSKTEDNELVIKEGAITSYYDQSHRILKKSIDKGQGLFDVVEYTYDEGNENPVSIVTTLSDGRKYTKNFNGNKIASITLLKDEHEFNIPIDEDGNIITYAKNRESFSDTYKRVFHNNKKASAMKSFKDLNSKAAKNNYFIVGEKVKIGQEFLYDISPEDLDVDRKFEIRYYQWGSKKAYRMPKGFFDNYETIVLDKDTTYWNLAKEYLINLGNKKPSKGEINEVCKALEFGNEGIPLKAGSEVFLPLQESIDENYPLTKYRVSKKANGDYNIKDLNNKNVKYRKTLKNGTVELYEKSKSNDDYKFLAYSPEGKLIKSFIKKDNIITGKEYSKSGQLICETKFVNGQKVSMESKLASQLAQDLSAKKMGIIPTTSKLFSEHMKQISSENIESVLQAYEYNNGETLASAIMREIGLSKKERVNYLSIIKNALKEKAASEGVFLDDFVGNFDKEVNIQMRQVGVVNPKYLNLCIDNLVSRINENDKGLYIKPNGQIDKDFMQNSIGDCWLLAAIRAISQTPKGKEILNKSLKFDDKGNIIVNLKGPNKSYIITQEELEGLNEFSSGDADVRAFEIAIGRYFSDKRGINPLNNLDGNNPAIAYEILTGKGGLNIIKFYSSVFKPITDAQIDDFNKPNHIAVASANKDLNIFDNKVYKSKEGFKLQEHHAYTIKGSDKDNVYLINPWDTSKITTVSRETFKSFFGYIEEFDL